MAIVHGKLIGPGGGAVAGAVKFVRRMATSSSELTIRRTIFVTARGDGKFQASLIAGTYDVWFNNQPAQFAILVPNNSEVYAIHTLVVDESPSGGGGGGSTPKATDTVSGTVKTNSADADPVVYLKSEVDALLGTYTHTQGASAATWTITHNLGRHPSVCLVDNSGNLMLAEVQYLSANQLQATFSSTEAGKAYLN